MDTSTGAFAPQITGLVAGETIGRCAPCYIKSDGTACQSNGTAADAKAIFAGICPRGATAGQPVTLFGVGARFRYGTGLTPGAILYLSATAGALATTASTGDAVGVAQCIDTTDIRITRAI
jgi:glyoxylase-like metal-dependent hydrolase (beta-lactamase superfamily II)